MTSLITCYALVWVAVTLYVARIGIQQSALQTALDRLKQHDNEEPFEHTPPAAWPEDASQSNPANSAAPGRKSMITGYLVCIAAAMTGWQSSHDGWIGGNVVNESRSEEPIAGATVVLQIKTTGDFVLLDQTTTDASGRFCFVTCWSVRTSRTKRRPTTRASTIPVLP